MRPVDVVARHEIVGPRLLLELICARMLLPGADEDYTKTTACSATRIEGIDTSGGPAMVRLP